MPEETTYLQLLAQIDAEVAAAEALATSFLTMIRERCGAELDVWITAAQASGTGLLRRFAQGLLTDFSAVLAGLTLPVSNGQVEGHINRLKMLKRQMFGRASFDLLRRRVLYGANSSL
jgi:transposase